MIVMPSNNSGAVFYRLLERFPGLLGWLIGPGGWRKAREGLAVPYAIDNARYAHYLARLAALAANEPSPEWDEPAFYALVERATDARWVAVPDVVASRKATLRDWDRHAPRIAAMGRHLAFVVQDGMTPKDVPPEASVVFIGGTKEWKWATLTIWTKHFPRVHVGKVNSFALLMAAYYAGAESTDGTGWFRGNGAQLAGLLRFLASISGIDASDLDTNIQKPRRGGETMLTGFPTHARPPLHHH